MKNRNTIDRKRHPTFITEVIYYTICEDSCSNSYTYGIRSTIDLFKKYTKIWFINGVDKPNWPSYRDWKADVLSVSPSSERSDEGLETSAFQSLYGGQFTLSTPLINQIFVYHSPHRRSTTVSSEANPLYSFVFKKYTTLQWKTLRS